MTDSFETCPDFPKALLDAIPVPMLLVDDDVRILWFNKLAGEHLGLISDGVLRRRTGEVIHCLHSTDSPDGCGRGPFCPECPVRNSVNHTMLGDQKAWREKATLHLVNPDKIVDVHLLVTASLMQLANARSVLLMLEDVSSLVRLQSLIPVCAWCHKVRNDKDYWQSLEEHLSDVMDVGFTHGICPDCLSKKRHLEKPPETRRD